MASGQSLVPLYPEAASFPTTNYATFDTRNGHLVLEFDPTTPETAYWSFLLPRHYGGNGITAVICWMVDTATSGNAVWGGSFERHPSLAFDLDADNFTTEIESAATAAPSTTGYCRYTTIAFTAGAQIGSLAVSEHGRFKLRRVANSASDTINSNDLQLLSVELFES